MAGVLDLRSAASQGVGGDTTLDAIDGADHFVLIDPTSAPWRRVTDWIDRTVD